MARAALLLDGIALQDPAKRGRIVELGAVPLLLQAIERAADALSADPLAAAPQAAAMLNCLGLLEGLAQGSKPVQELARKQVAEI